MATSPLWLDKSKSGVVNAWTRFATDAANGSRPLNTLRANKIVKNVFDHVSPKEAQSYVGLAASLPKAMFEAAVKALGEWDGATGGRRLYRPLDISLTSTKYLGTLGKLWSRFGKDLYEIKIWNEIGGGLGGFGFMIGSVFPDINVNIFDLPEIAALQNKIFAKLGRLSNGSTCVSYGFGLDLELDTGIKDDAGEGMLVSEHAWSECPYAVRKVYLDTVFSCASRGWLTNNFGSFTDLTRDAALEQVRSIHPSAQFEDTFVSASSYSISWGPR